MSVTIHEGAEALIVSSDHKIRKELADNLRVHRMHPLLSSSAVQGLLVLSSHSVSIALCEDRLIDAEYLDFVHHARRLARDVPVIVVTQVFDADERITAIASGDFHYVGWPPDRPEFEYALLSAFREHDRRRNLMSEQAASR